MQKFEPDQLVLVQYGNGGPWRLRRYSFFDGDAHEMQDGSTFDDDHIIPYKENENLLGTTDLPTPKWEPKRGEIVAVRQDGFDHWVFAQFKRKNGKLFEVTNRSDGCSASSLFDFCEPLRAHFTIPEA